MNSKFKVRRGQTTKIRRKNPYGDDWRDLRKSVVDRDRECQKCGSTDRLQVHHLIPLSKGGTNGGANLIVLCHNCHQKMPKHRHLR